ncbi:MAG TPA: outer membrane beta-barrel protein [Chitinophagaceae bacterium]|nr:outer membrane beta-barrel protein [Chitinophagaceae bacterium]
MKKLGLILVVHLLPFLLKAQAKDGGLEGTLIDSVSRQAVQGATVELSSFNGLKKSILSDKTGFFSFDSLPNAFYRLKISYMGFGSILIDSIQIHSEKKDIILGEINLKPSASNMDAIVIYSEKPLIQTKEGNIILNVGESPLAAGSNAADLLKNMPLVNTDPDGKVSVRGREPRILVDEKPVELNGQQLNDFLESFPGGMIEKIEVMTNPPPQFANEPGGVINIVTRKGKTGTTGRVTVFGGTRGELGANASINFRKKGLSMSFVAGNNYNEFQGNGSGSRENYYADSSNELRTENQYLNKSTRPYLRFNLDYDLSAKNNLNLQALYNGNKFENDGLTTYRNINDAGELYKISDRNIISEGNSMNPSMNMTYTHRGKAQGEQLRVIFNINTADQNNNKYFRQEYYDANYQSTGPDSVQSQLGDTRNLGYNIRLNYDKPYNQGKTTVSTGASWNDYRSRVILNSYYQLPTGEDIFSDLFSSDLLFNQRYYNLRASIKQQIAKSFYVTAGSVFSETEVSFDVYSQKTQSKNSYQNLLPFVNFNKSYENGVNLNASYRKAIRRPGIGEMNPAIDYTDPYNIRYGNPELLPSISHNFDIVGGRTVKKYYFNLGLGYNIVDDIFARVRTLIEGGKTTITWENISAKKEYEVSGWAGYNFSRSFRVNINAGYTYSAYSDYDITVNKYQNGGSWTSKLNITYSPGELWNITGNTNFNRYANPQGSVRSTVAMNIGIQRKFLEKKLLATINMVDPIIQQSYDNVTVGPNFKVVSTGLTETRNFRLTLTYLFSVKKKEKES